MNSLEFIENQIKEIDKQLDYYKRKIDEDCNFKSFIDSYTTTIKDLTNLKNTLLQIKTELEAWEVVKECFEYFEMEEGDVFTHKVEGYFQTKQFDSKDLAIIKKALEIKNE